MKKFLSNQHQNVFLWSPILLAFGIALYFSISTEPSILTVILSFIIGICGIVALRRFPIIALLMCIATGFGYAGIYTHMKNVPQISHDIHGIEITGTVTEIENTSDKTRIYLNTEKYGTVRVSGASTDNIKIGDIISGNGGLFKPKPADIPNGFDFARHSYFNNITAIGYIKDIKIIYTPEYAVYSLRTKIKNAAKSFLTDTLLLGYKNSLPNAHRAIWNTNGIAHMWSISGYHMTLISGWLFIIFYIIFRCIPKLVRRVPARIPATICSWVGLIGYLFISGCGVATLRAFFMATLVMLAILVGRDVISLRMASLAFIVLIIINPYYVMTAGFQLSFAAIFGILWIWNEVKPAMPSNRILKYIYAASITALVAGIFTAPFVLMHFNELPIYGILGNLIFVPLFSFILMPCVIAGTICALFGFYAPISFSHRIYDILFSIATHIGNIPYSQISIGNISNTSIVFIIAGLCCLIFIRNIDTFRNILARHINIVFCSIFISIGITICILTPRPIFYISNDHKLIGAVINNKLKFNKTHDSGNYFAFDTWKKTNGEQPGTENIRLTKESGVYTISMPKWKILYIQNFVPLSKNINSICQDHNIKFIASYFDINSKTCSNKIIHGGAVIYKSGRIVHIPSNRLWHNLHE